MPAELEAGRFAAAQLRADRDRGPRRTVSEEGERLSNLYTPLNKAIRRDGGRFAQALRCQNSTMHHIACVLTPRSWTKRLTLALEALLQRAVCLLTAAVVLPSVMANGPDGDEAVLKPGAVLERRLEWAEEQEVLDVWTGASRASRRVRLSADVRWRVLRAGEREVVLAGQVLTGTHELSVRGFLELEDVYGVPLDGLVFRIAISPRAVRLEPGGASWKRVRAEFEAIQKERRLPQSVRDEVTTGLLRHLERAHATSLWPLIGLKDDRGGITTRLDLPLLRKNGSASGTLRLVPLPNRARYFADTRGQEIPVRRWHRSSTARRSAPLAVLDEPGTLAWRLDDSRQLESCRLRAIGFYRDTEELEEFVEYPGQYWQRHRLDLWLGARGSEAPSIERYHELPPRREPPDPRDAVVRREERRELARLVEEAAAGPQALARALDEYATFERTAKGSAALRAAIHFALAEVVARRAFGRVDGGAPDGGIDVARLLASDDRLPLVVLCLRAVSHSFAKLGDAERVRYCRAVLARDDVAFARWGARMLAHGGWGGSLHALIDALAREEEIDGVGPLERSLRLDLQRRLGIDARARRAGELRALAAEAVARRQDRPHTFPGALPIGAKSTWFAEAVGSGTVFLIDVSGRRRTTPISRPSRREIPLWIVKAHRAVNQGLAKMAPTDRFGLVTFHDSPRVFGRGLVEASPAQKKAALQFIGKSSTSPRSRLAKGLEAALTIPGCDTIVLWTDAHRPASSSLEMELLIGNYLRGIRVITYGHGMRTAPSRGEPLTFLERIADAHFGWCRLLP